MKTPFDAHSGLVVIHAVLHGPVGILALVLALDTGATRTTIGHSPLISLGYDPSQIAERIQVTMGSSVEHSPVVRVERIDALGLSAAFLDVVAHTLPPTAGRDGFLGLDFLRNHKLNIDFTAGYIDLE